MVTRAFSVAAPKLLTALLKYECFPDFCREQATLLAGDGASRVVELGTLMGLRTIDLVAANVDATADGGNTGNGILTVADPATGAGVKAGDYVLTITGGAFDGAIAAVAGNTGNGAPTMDATETAVGVVAGVYRAVCIEPAANAGTFEVFDPAGVSIGVAAVGVLFAGVVRFTIADGATDFVAGDAFTITVTPIVPANGLGAFSVVEPDGVALAAGVVGTAYSHEIKFTLADGATNFVVGDSFTITVPEGDGKAVAWDPAATDGSAVVDSIALVKTVAVDGLDAPILVERRGPAIIASAGIEWPAGVTDNQKAAAVAALALKGILVR
ncbi:MAG: head decoration protein [Devosia nanyangense]|uniref:Head decoration protein n=1 Tax=Devosia nanyangense TaxID=1228055 RepID=A0A933NYM0_9HYPH|nr:head decoration protein [Devosia nanyangense]